MPAHLPADVRRRLEPIRLLICDVDGVLTDGGLLYSAAGEQMKRFCVRDGLGIRLLITAGINVGIISGRPSPAVQIRCSELGNRDDLVRMGYEDKKADRDSFKELLDLEDHQVAVIGDDLPDLSILGQAGFAACPADAAPEVLAACHLVCGASGGQGAVREVAELLLKGQRLWLAQVAKWTVREDRSRD